MLRERPGASDEQQGAFIASYSQHDGDVRLVPEALFAAISRPPDGNSRLYHNDRLGFGTGALYGPEFSGLPQTLIKSFGHNEYLTIKVPDFKPLSGGLSLGGRKGDYSFHVQYYPHVGEEQSPMFYLGMVDERTSRYEPGYRALFMPAWTEIKERRDADEILAKLGIKYARDAGVFEARFDDLILRARDVAPIDGILDRYFPQQLRDNPLDAGIELDEWARADWMQDFGITWVREQRIETSVFDAQALSTPTASEIFL